MAERRQALRGAAAAAALALPLAGACASAPARPASTATHTVVIEDMRFAPATLQVRRGERVTWVNKDLVPHTVTAVDGSFDSHAIAAGASWSLTVAKTGPTDYACAYHPTMLAHLIIR